MDFDPGTAKPDPDDSGFDAKSAVADDAGGFDPSTAKVAADDGGFDAATAKPVEAPTGFKRTLGIAKIAAGLIPKVMPEFQPPGTEESRKAAIDFAVPLEQRAIAGMTTPFGAGALAKPDPNAASAGIARTMDEAAVSQLTPANLVLLHGLGLTGEAAAGGSAIAKGAMALAQGGFGAKMAKTAGEQAGEASVADPDATPAQTAAKWTAASLSGLGAIAATVGLTGDMAKLVNGKQPVDAINNLNAAVKNAADPDAAQVAQEATEKYVAWWESQLNAHDAMAKSPEGAKLLREQLSSQERVSQRRAKDFLRSKIDEVKQSIADRQIADPETGVTEPAGASAAATPAPAVDDGSIPANVQLSGQAQDVAAQEHEPFTPPPTPARAAQSATPEADAQEVVDRVNAERTAQKKIDQPPRLDAREPTQEPTKTAPNPAPVPTTVEERAAETQQPAAQAEEFDASTAKPEDDIPATRELAKQPAEDLTAGEEQPHEEEPEPNSESAFSRGPTMEEPPSPDDDIPVTLEPGNKQGGHIDPKTLAVLASGGSGAAYGYSQGKNPEDRLRKAVGYGATGALAGFLAMRIPEAFNSPGGKAVGFAALKNTLFGKDMPNMRAASDASTDAAFRLVGARVYGKAKGIALAAQVLGDKYKDPVFAKKLGAVMVQDMQEAKLLQLHEALQTADKAEAPAIQQQIDNVKPVWEMPDNGGIKSADDFAAALKDPDIQGAIGRHKELVQGQAQAAHAALGGKIADVGPNTGAFINTESIDPEGLTENEQIPDSNRGNLQNPLKKKTAFGQGRSGTADQYEMDYNNQVARMASGNAERTAQRDYYQTLEDEGLAKRLPPGERPEGDDAGKFKRERTQELSSTGKVENTWIRNDVFGEHRQLMNTDSPLDSHMAVVAAKALNAVQLKSLTDPTFHVANIISAIAGSPGGGALLADLGRKIPGVDITDALTRLTSKVRDVAADTPEIRQAAAEVSRIGAMREGHPGMVQAVDKAGRLVMNDLYDNLVEQKLAPDEEGPRRDFINQVGQYNARLMGKIKAFMKEAGFSPFIVAGQNFNRLAIKRVTAAPGVTPASMGAGAKMVATNLAGLATIGATVAAANYMVSGKPGGPAGTPVGAIGWMGKDDQGKDVLRTVDPLKWTNLRRGLRITGANALLNGAMSGRDLNHSGGQAFEDIKNGLIGPWAGPAVNAASVLTTGKSMSGFQEAPRANPLDHTNTPTLDQDKNNLVAAGSELNPHVAAFLQGGKQKNPNDFSAEGATKGLGKSLLKAVGVGEGKPGDVDRGAAETALYTKETAQSQRTVSQQSLAEQWSGLNKQQRIDGLKSMLKTAEANPEAQAMPPEERAAFREKQIYNLLDDVAAVKHGVTNSDRMVKDLGVEDGSRARYLVDRLLERPEGQQQRQFLKDQMAKGNLTPDVFEKMAPMLQQRGWRRSW